MSDIFISYASQDRPKAQVLAHALEQHGWSVWWDRTIPTGKRFEQVIQGALAGARCVMVLWSKQSVTSDWVVEEAEEGRKRHILVPVFIEDVLPPMGFRRIQAADLMGWDGDGTSPAFQRLVGDIAAILGPPVKTEMGRVGGGTPVVEREPTLAPGPAPLKAKPPVEPPRPEPAAEPSRYLSIKKLLPWSLGMALLLAVLGGFWIFRGRERVPRVETPATAPTAPSAPPPETEPGERVRTRPSRDMVLVPAGEFWMGCNEKVDKRCDKDEKPGERVHLNAFYIDKHEVTVADYRKCVEAGKCSSNELTKYPTCGWGKPSREDLPINCVHWNQAKTYCAWAGKRLPTEAEWEKAARGTDGRIYPWGNQWDSSKANLGTRGTASVGSYPGGASPYGVYDMADGPWEWTSSLYKPYPYKANDGREDAKATGFRVLRGGSWFDSAVPAPSSARMRGVPDDRIRGVGFRCAKTP